MTLGLLDSAPSPAHGPLSTATESDPIVTGVGTVLESCAMKLYNSFSMRHAARFGDVAVPRSWWGRGSLTQR